MNLTSTLLLRIATLILVLSPAILSICAVNTGLCNDKKSVTNIVLILADDLGYGELGCYGQAKIKTPHLDRLAKEGMRFTQHYSGAPVCAPSRCVLMTGKHLGHAEIRGNRQARNAVGESMEGQHPLSTQALTIAEVLHERGYATGAFGKWGLGTIGSSGEPHAQGFDLFFGYNCQAVAHSYFPSHLWRNGEKVTLNTHPIPGHKKQPEGEVTMQAWQGEKYAPSEILREAKTFLHKHVEHPFLLYLPFIEPHVAMQPPPQIVERYPSEWDDRAYRGQCGYLPHPRPRAGYAAMITSLDEHVGTILKTLEDLKLTDNTLVIFTSDNGTTHESSGDEVLGIGGVDGNFFNSTAGLRGRKGSLHEGGIRVPLIVRWPGHVPAGSQSDEPSYFADHFPTLCRIADVQVPAGLDGVDLTDIYEAKENKPHRKPMVWVFPEYGGQVAVRWGDWKVIRKNLQRPKQESAWELYNLSRDPQEKQNLATMHPELIAKAIDILKEETIDNKVFPLKIPGVN
jgi:arylsulfatase A-like enzyme